MGCLLDDAGFAQAAASERLLALPSAPYPATRPMTGRESVFDSDGDGEDPLPKPANVAGQTTKKG